MTLIIPLNNYAKLILLSLYCTHPDSSNQLCRSHIMQVALWLLPVGVPLRVLWGYSIDIEYNKRLDHRRPCLEDDLTAGSNL